MVSAECRTMRMAVYVSHVLRVRPRSVITKTHAYSRLSSRWSVIVRDGCGRSGHQVVDRTGCDRLRCSRCGCVVRARSALVRAHGESGWTARMVPLTVDGLIYASSMVMLDSARRKTPVPALARWLLGLGIAATLAANIAHGVGHGLIGAAVAAWPAVALVGSYELLIMVIHSSQVPAEARSRTSTTRTHCRSRQPSCSPRNSRPTRLPRCARSALSSTSASPGHSGCRTTSSRELQCGWKVPLHEQPEGKASSHGRG
jgi:hypothetical protein